MDKFCGLQISKEKEDDELEENVTSKKSQVWKYFKKLSGGRAECIKCGNVYKMCGNTSNMGAHLKRAHPLLGKDISKCDVPMTQFLVSCKQYEKTSQRKEKLDKALVKMVSTDVQPFKIVEDPGFINFIHCLDPKYNLPSRRTLRDVLLKNMYDGMQIKLKNMLQTVEYCAITTDGWTSRSNDHYITVTCHFVHEFELRCAVLSTSKLLKDTDQSSQNIAESVQTILNDWGVFEKTSAIVTDNAAVMLKACNLLKKRNMPCCAHTLNLVVQDALVLPNINGIITKCKKIVTYFKSSSVAYSKLKNAQQSEKSYSLIQEVPTRWNSSYAMMKRMLLLKDFVSPVLLSISKAPSPLTADEIAVIDDLTKLFEPFDKATNQLSGSAFVTLSLVIPITGNLIFELTSLEKKLQTLEGQEACKFILENLISRLSPYEARTPTRIATLIDPRFKKEGFRSSNVADTSATLLQNDLAANFSRPTMETPPTPNREQTAYFSFMEEKLLKKNYSTTVDSIIKVRQYIEKPHAAKSMCPLQYWKAQEAEMPELAKCAKAYLCIPACSTESERMFSKAGALISDRRASLKPASVDMLLFTNKNQWL